MTEWYADLCETYTIQGTITLLSMVKASQATTLLEVACGAGIHSEVIATNYLRKGGVLVCTDFSKSNLQKANTRF